MRTSNNPQVFLWLAFCRNTPTDTTLVPVQFQLSPRLRCTAQYNACLSESYSSCIRELAWSTVTHSFSHRVWTATIGTTPSIRRPRTSSWWSCPLLYSHCAWLRRPSLLVGLASFDITELQGDAQTTSLSHSVRTNAAPQNQKQIAHCIPRQRTLVKWNLSVDAVHTASSASGIKNASQS